MSAAERKPPSLEAHKDPNYTDVFSHVYSVQALRAQVVDLEAPRQVIHEAAFGGTRSAGIDWGQNSHLLDVFPLSRRGKAGEEEGHASLLVLHVSGKQNNELGEWV